MNSAVIPKFRPWKSRCVFTACCWRSITASRSTQACLYVGGAKLATIARLYRGESRHAFGCFSANSLPLERKFFKGKACTRYVATTSSSRSDPAPAIAGNAVVYLGSEFLWKEDENRMCLTMVAQRLEAPQSTDMHVWDAMLLANDVYANLVVRTNKTNTYYTSLISNLFYRDATGN